MAPDFPSFNLPPTSPGNVANQKRGGQGGRMLRKRRRQRADGSWEEVDEEVEEEPGVELEADRFRGGPGDGGDLDDFMADELPWAAEDAELAAKEAAEAARVAEAERAAQAPHGTAEAPPAGPAPDAAPLFEPQERRLPPPPAGRGTGGLSSPGRPMAPPPGGRGTGGLSMPGKSAAPPVGGRGTGGLMPPAGMLPRGNTGKLPPLPAAGAGSPYLTGSWAYRVVSHATGAPIAATVELSFTEARVMPVQRRQAADTDGWIRGQGLPPGRYQMTITAPGHHPIAEVRFLRPDAPDEMTFRLQPL